VRSLGRERRCCGGRRRRRRPQAGHARTTPGPGRRTRSHGRGSRWALLAPPSRDVVEAGGRRQRTVRAHGRWSCSTAEARPPAGGK